MGVRQDVKLEYGEKQEIYLYSHWDEPEILKEKIAKVLNRKQRWNDAPYLARMIFSAIIKEAIDDETGYGLAPYEMGEDEPIIINLNDNTVNGIPYQEFINDTI